MKWLVLPLTAIVIIIEIVVFKPHLARIGQRIKEGRGLGDKLITIVIIFLLTLINIGVLIYLSLVWFNAL